MVLLVLRQLQIQELDAHGVIVWLFHAIFSVMFAAVRCSGLLLATLKTMVEGCKVHVDRRTKEVGDALLGTKLCKQGKSAHVPRRMWLDFVAMLNLGHTRPRTLARAGQSSPTAQYLFIHSSIYMFFALEQ